MNKTLGKPLKGLSSYRWRVRIGQRDYRCSPTFQPMISTRQGNFFPRAIANFGVALIGVLREQFTVGLIGMLERDSVLAWV